MMATDRLPSGTSIEEGYKFYAARPFLAGLFYWTGFDYRGEPHPYGWPQVASQSGIIDLCGFPKDPFYYLKSVWTDEPVLHLLPHWNWKGSGGKPINVWAYTNCDEVELFINQKSLGRKPLPKNSHIEWTVKYEPGILLAKGFKNGKEILTEKMETTDAPTIIQFNPNRQEIMANGEDVSVITVKTNDSKGRFVPDAGNEISFSIEGSGKIIGVGNGDPSSHDPDKYIESVNQVTIENLKAQIVQRKPDYPEVNPGFNDSDWPTAVDGQGKYIVKLKDTSEIAVIRGSFSLPVISANIEVSLFPKSLGEIQAVYINGHLVAENIERFDEVKEFKLENRNLQKGKNIYAVICKPLVPRFQWDDLNTDPGAIKIYEPAGIWKRKLFNGLAQVIVQSTKQAGEITLSASSTGLAKSLIKIQSKPTALRPTVK
jgi:beta-galactosidase